MTGDGAQRIHGDGHLELHDWLENDRPGAASRLDDSTSTCSDESDFLGVHRVGFAVVDGDADVLQREPANRTRGQRLPNAFLHGGDELLRDGAADHLADEFETRTARQRCDAQVNLAELSCTTGLFLVAVVTLRRSRDRL